MLAWGSVATCGSWALEMWLVCIEIWCECNTHTGFQSLCTLKRWNSSLINIYIDCMWVQWCFECTGLNKIFIKANVIYFFLLFKNILIDLFGCARSYLTIVVVAYVIYLVPQPGVEPRRAAWGVWSLSHWSASKVPLFTFPRGCYCCCHFSRARLCATP